MSKVRVYEVAKQLNLDPKAVVGLFQSVGYPDVRNHMSSVEPDAVERVKRHLEKQKTFNVVEEKVRSGVVKRRAVAKPGAASGELPPAPVSVPALSTPAAAASSPALPAPVSERDLGSRRDVAPAAPSVPAARESVPAVAAAASKPTLEERKSSREVERVSTRDVTERRSSRDVTVPAERTSAKRLPTDDVSESVAAEPAPAAPSSRKLVAPSAPAVPEAPASVAAPVAAPSAPAVPPAPASVAAVAAPPAPEPAPVVAPPPAPAPPAAPEPGAAAPAAVSSPSEPPKRVAPKSGIEYWTGRSGVPMPVPPSAQRTGIGGGATGINARRVQYDPRAGSGPVRGGPGGYRGGPMMGRGGPMGRGGMMGMRGRPMAPGLRRTPAVSTKEMSDHKKVIRIEENVTLSSMAAKMSLKSTELLMKLLSMGMTGVHINSTLDADTAKILANEFGWEVEDVAVSEEESIALARGDETEITVDEGVLPRPPVVTVMGHVDHGKTSLLDKIRKANVAGGEAGGITQHVGAYRVTTEQGPIVFLDTPGHEAFTAMRARGASVTDLVVLVVAADDGVMPQTREAVAHAKAAKVPIIVAVNKIDKPSAEPERVKRELVEVGLQPEEWGGDTIFVNVSAQTGEGIPQLLEMLHLQSEVLDLRANPDKPASGTVIEALLDRGKGPVARILVQEGTLRVGDFVLAGAGFGKVRAMMNEHGKQIHAAGPATPVEILGLSDVPGAGDQVHAVKDPKKAQEIAESRKGKMAKSLIPSTAKVSLEELSKRISDSNLLELRVIVKGDVQGSVEAVADTLAKLSTDRVRLSVIQAAVGAITEGDVNLAIASKAIVIGFNVRPAGKASALADENKVEIRLYSIIYNAVDDVRSAMEGLLPATRVEKDIGKAEVRAVFKIRGVAVAGSMITQGTVKRGGFARVKRGGELIFDGKFTGLKRFKEDVKELAEGFECGISLDGFTDFKELDILECYEVEEVKQKL